MAPPSSNWGKCLYPARVSQAQRALYRAHPGDGTAASPIRMENRLASVIECAHLSWAIGRTPSPGGAGGEALAAPLLPGWKALPSSRLSAHTRHTTPSSGFGARAYANGSTGELAIAYRGVDLPSAMPPRVGQDLPDLLMGLSQWVGRTGVEIGAEQRMQALAHYLTVVEWARVRGWDPAQLVFTGHGLGAALAASMALWLDRPATLFAAAPFAGIGQNGGRRENLVHVSVQGELLGHARERMPIGVSAPHDRVIDLGPQPVSEALALHRMDLHLALLLDERLPVLIQRWPDLLPALREGSHDPARDPLASLVEDQLRQGLGRPSALQRFVDGLEKRPLLEFLRGIEVKELA